MARDSINQLFTVPNGLSILRLLGVPVFFYLLLGPHADYLALLVLVIAGMTDWLDGKLARWLDQTSRIGALLDPAADRLYIVATLIAFVLRDIVPWWIVIILASRELLVGICVLLLRRRGYSPFEVSYLGKSATFTLLYAFPMLLLAQGTSTIAKIALPIATAFLMWGIVLYLWSGMLYLYQFTSTFRRGPIQLS